jgi:hypothetical protein
VVHRQKYIDLEEWCQTMLYSADDGKEFWEEKDRFSSIIIDRLVDWRILDFGRLLLKSRRNYGYVNVLPG